MSQSITTKYLGPSNVRGARVKATCDAGSVTVSWDHALNVEQNHAEAARTLARKFEWSGTWVMGTHGDVFHFVLMTHAYGFEL